MSNTAITSRVIYSGGLRTQAVHLKSGNKIITDAPPDNHGKGEAFSPTDLLATCLANCMLTVMGTGRTCPVAQSLHPELIQNITFVFN
jgi:hypothetical protein